MITMAVLLQTPPGGAEVAHSEQQRLVVFEDGLRWRGPVCTGPLEGTTADLGRRVAAVATAGVPVMVITLDEVRRDGGAAGKATRRRAEGVAA
jgi:hypothetical protein